MGILGRLRLKLIFLKIAFYRAISANKLSAQIKSFSITLALRTSHAPSAIKSIRRFILFYRSPPRAASKRMTIGPDIATKATIVNCRIGSKLRLLIKSIIVISLITLPIVRLNFAKTNVYNNRLFYNFFH